MHSGRGAKCQSGRANRWALCQRAGTRAVPSSAAGGGSSRPGPLSAGRRWMLIAGSDPTQTPSAAGVHHEAGVTTFDGEEVEVKRAMAKPVARAIVVADRTAPIAAVRGRAVVLLGGAVPAAGAGRRAARRDARRVALRHIQRPDAP
jgi:hypothetical protein